MFSGSKLRLLLIYIHISFNAIRFSIYMYLNLNLIAKDIKNANTIITYLTQVLVQKESLDPMLVTFWNTMRWFVRHCDIISSFQYKYKTIRQKGGINLPITCAWIVQKISKSNVYVWIVMLLHLFIVSYNINIIQSLILIVTVHFSMFDIGLTLYDRMLWY